MSFSGVMCFAFQWVGCPQHFQWCNLLRNVSTETGTQRVYSKAAQRQHGEGEIYGSGKGCDVPLARIYVCRKSKSTKEAGRWMKRLKDMQYSDGARHQNYSHSGSDLTIKRGAGPVVPGGSLVNPFFCEVTHILSWQACGIHSSLKNFFQISRLIADTAAASAVPAIVFHFT